MHFGAVYNGHYVIIAFGLQQALVIFRLQYVSRILQIAGGPNQETIGNSDMHIEVAEVIVKLKAAEIRCAVPAVDVVVHRNSWKKISDERRVRFYFARAPVRSFVECVMVFDANREIAAGRNLLPTKHHVGGIDIILPRCHPFAIHPHGINGKAAADILQLHTAISGCTGLVIIRIKLKPDLLQRIGTVVQISNIHFAAYQQRLGIEAYVDLVVGRVLPIVLAWSAVCGAGAFCISCFKLLRNVERLHR